MPALVLAGASVASQILFVATPPGTRSCGGITAAIDRSRPLYFAVLFALSFAVLLHSYRRTHGVTARQQMKWLVWGTGRGRPALPRLLRDPLRPRPRAAASRWSSPATCPLALIPLSLAYAVVKHRLMDVELIFRRTLVYLLAMAAILGICLLVVGLYDDVLSGNDEPHVSLIAILLGAGGDPALHAGEGADPGRRSTGSSTGSATTRDAPSSASPRT